MEFGECDMVDDAGDPQAPDFGPTEKLQIQLAEYSAGRAALLQRHTTLIQFFIVPITAFVTMVGLISVYKFYVGGAVVTAVLLIGFLLAYRFIQIDIIEASNNVRGLEAAVNELLVNAF
jgi:hypothetical protein